ncbi:hypothetical protein HaLaN_14184, partial [Haematococcus lacustris]
MLPAAFRCSISRPLQQLAQEVATAARVVAAAGPGEAKTAAINAFTSSAQQLLAAAGRLHAIEPELTETLMFHTTDDLRKVVGVKAVPTVELRWRCMNTQQQGRQQGSSRK